MNKIGMALLLIVLFAVGCGATVLSLRPTIETSAQTLVNHAVEVDPLADVLAVRDQAQDQSSSWWALIALLLISGLLIAAVLVGMGRFPKVASSWRRMRKPVRSSPHPASRVLPPQETQALPQLPRTSPVQPVPDWTDGVYND
jgi:hypothetical protein